MFDTSRDRIATLADYDLTDTGAERSLDAIVRDAAAIADTPIATISLIDDRRQYFAAKLGFTHDEDPIEDSICAHAIRSDELLVVEDARADDRFRDMAGVAGGPLIRFYAGAPLKMDNGVRIGTLCVIDVEPRAGLDPAERRLLQNMARRTVAAFEARRAMRQAAADAVGVAGDGYWLAEAGRLLDRAAVALDEAGATAPLACLSQVIAMVDRLQARAA